MNSRIIHEVYVHYFLQTTTPLELSKNSCNLFWKSKLISRISLHIEQLQLVDIVKVVNTFEQLMRLIQYWLLGFHTKIALATFNDVIYHYLVKFTGHGVCADFISHVVKSKCNFAMC